MTSDLHRDRSRRIADLRRRIAKGELTSDTAPATKPVPPCPVIDAFLDGFARRASAKTPTIDHCVDAGLAAAAKPIVTEIERSVVEEAALISASAIPPSRVVTEMDGMLDGRVGETAVPVDPEVPNDPINAKRFALLVAAELQAAASREDARSTAMSAMGDRDVAAASALLPAPPPMDPMLFVSHVRRLTAALRSSPHLSASIRLDDAA